MEQHAFTLRVINPFSIWFPEKFIFHVVQGQGKSAVTTDYQLCLFCLHPARVIVYTEYQISSVLQI
jgi:hypothetical protein